MTFRRRSGRIAAALALAAATLALVPGLATAEPTKQVVSVEPVQGADLAAIRDDLFSAGDRKLVVAEDGTLQIFEDQDFTSANSTRRLGEVSLLSTRPEVFSLRDATFNGATGNFVTSVKNQFPFGACWAFAAASAAETSYLSEVGQPVTADGDPIDISEKQIAWFAMNPLPADAANGQGGEGTYVNLDPATQSGDFYNLGGNFYDSTMLFSSMTGPLDESVDPILGYHNANGQYDHYDDGTIAPVTYGDWSVPAEYRGMTSMELEESFSVPSPASWEPIEGSDYYEYVYNPQGVTAIKDQLLAGRPVAMGFCADLSTPGDIAENNYINVDTWAQYTYESPFEGAEGGAPNHAVAIIGYDSNYPRTNFNADHMPPGDGAFLCKNNWGGKDSDDANRSDWGIDDSGFFYLSFYDKSIQVLESYDFITPADDDLTYGTSAEGEGSMSQYQYAFLSQSPAATVADDISSIANVYEMEQDSVLRNVSVLTYSYDTDVHFEVFRLDEGATEPSDGERLWTHDDSFQLGGYHRVEIDEPVFVKAGDRIGVVATISLPGGQTELPVFTNSAKAMEQVMHADPSEQVWVDTVTNPGESFYGSPATITRYDDFSYEYSDYTWADYGVENNADLAAATEIVNGSNFAQLLKARDDAYASYLAADEGDEVAYAAYEQAQTALSDFVQALPDEATAYFYRWDNFPINLSAEAYDVENPPTADTVEILRLYNPATGEHLYTDDTNEARVLTTERGWNLESTEWVAPARANVEVYRLYNPYTGEHFYTCSSHERGVLIDAGWNDEGVAFHSDGHHTVPVYRLANPYVDGVAAHLFTTSAQERDLCIAAGMRDENIGWYGL